ncbi:hypothetical protein FHG87_020012 [Trinorchestia longiramus]|nr:hypothetical protein FHG87_020012 [Trinorchestia longiramus]
MNGHVGILEEKVNDNGHKLIDFCEGNEFENLNVTIGNGLHTWESKEWKAAIDYVLMNYEARQHVREIYCNLCLPLKKKYNASKKSLYNLKKHVSLKHKPFVLAFESCIRIGRRVRANRRDQFYIRASASKHHVFGGAAVDTIKTEVQCYDDSSPGSSGGPEYRPEPQSKHPPRATVRTFNFDESAAEGACATCCVGTCAVCCVGTCATCCVGTCATCCVGTCATYYVGTCCVGTCATCRPPLTRHICQVCWTVYVTA